MGWRIVEIETDEYVQLYLNNLMIKRFNEKIMINISDIDTLILNNDRSTISLKLLNALTNSNVNIIIMDSAHEPASYVIPVSGNHMSLKIIEKQIAWSHIYKGKFWQEVIRNKIFNQKKILSLLSIDNIECFDEYIDSVKHYDISNREGHAAKVYWHKLFGNDFIRDQKSVNNKMINSMLNYGYAILRGLVIKSIYKKGLDPRLAIFHKSFSNFFALASDLMEAFRPLVDKIVYKNRNTDFFTYDIKDELIGINEIKVGIDGKKFFLNQAIDQTVDSLVKEKGWIWVDLWD